MFAYCGLVVEIPTELLNIKLLLPFQRQPRIDPDHRCVCVCVHFLLPILVAGGGKCRHEDSRPGSKSFSRSRCQSRLTFAFLHVWLHFSWQNCYVLAEVIDFERPTSVAGRPLFMHVRENYHTKW